MSGFFLYHSSRRRMTPPLQAFIAFVKHEAKRRGVAPSGPPRAGVHPKYRLVGAARR
jgi:hypothetical protein